jgi:phytoene synthase
MTTPARVAWPGYAPWAETVAACRDEFVRVARSFGLLPWLIPPVDREDVALLYCFCRRLDDAVDEAPDAAAARAALDRVVAELAGRVEPRPLIAAFLAGAARSGLPLECAGALIEGMRGDLGPVRIPDDRALLQYSYRVSAAVGLMLAPLLAVRDREALVRAVDLGLALQLSNILLGVAADAAKNRVYLPATRLERHGLTPDDVLAAPQAPALRPVKAELAALAEIYYRSAELGAARTPFRYRHGIMLLGRVYGGMGRRAVDSFEAPAHPSQVPLGFRIRCLLEVLLRGWHPAVLGLWRPPPHDPALHAAIAGWYGADPETR